VWFVDARGCFAGATACAAEDSDRNTEGVGWQQASSTADLPGEGRFPSTGHVQGKGRQGFQDKIKITSD
jgi:hypothetical protein